MLKSILEYWYFIPVFLVIGLLSLAFVLSTKKRKREEKATKKTVETEKEKERSAPDKKSWLITRAKNFFQNDWWRLAFSFVLLDLVLIKWGHDLVSYLTVSIVVGLHAAVLGIYLVWAGTGKGLIGRRLMTVAWIMMILVILWPKIGDRTEKVLGYVSNAASETIFTKTPSAVAQSAPVVTTTTRHVNKVLVTYREVTVTYPAGVDINLPAYQVFDGKAQAGTKVDGFIDDEKIAITDDGIKGSLHKLSPGSERVLKLRLDRPDPPVTVNIWWAAESRWNVAFPKNCWKP